jgi:tetratricopeptide (TPR) repeat protein
MKNYWYLHIIISICASSCIETTISNGLSDTSSLPVVSAPAEEDTTSTTRKIRQKLTDRERKRREQNLVEALDRYNEKPTDLDNIIWYGRRLAYLARFEEAIEIYSNGLAIYPNSYKLLRHRGHRYITIREFGQAVEDLQKAAFYVNNKPNEIEPDGIPNAYNKPLSNIKFNIFYHLGIAYYIDGNYDKAVSSFRKCKKFSNNNDLDVALANWLYASYRKLGNLEAANLSVVDISTRMFLIENRAYHDLIMLYRGFVTPEVLIERNTNNGVLSATVGYGIGNWLQMEGRKKEAQVIYQRILNSDQWDSFGYIAAEAEVEVIQLASQAL